MSTLDAQRFEGKQRENAAIQLSRDLFLDSLTFAITAITIGFPALSWVYSYVSLIKVNPTIRCFPPDNLSLIVSIADLEYFCQYNQSLHAAFFPIVIAFLAFWIAVPHFIWRNYHTGKFDLFISLVTKLKRNYKKSPTESKLENQMIAQQLVDIFSQDNQNSMFISYLIVKGFQAAVALFTCLLTVILYHTYFSSLRSIFTLTSNVPTFDCDVNKFDTILNDTSQNIQVPCIENFSRSTAFILFVDFILLLIVFLVSIGSILWYFLVHPKELEHDQAAKFSYHTGMSLHCYKSKFDLKKYRCTCTGNDLDFLILLLRRTDRSLVELLWEVRTHSKIELLTNDDLMRSNLDYRQRNLDDIYKPIYEDFTQSLRDSDEDLESATLTLRGHVRKASLEYVKQSDRETALYITFVPYSLGIPLALSRVFDTKVLVVNFDPFFEKDGGNFYQLKKWSGNVSMLTFPSGILSSDTTKVFDVASAFYKYSELVTEIKDINFIVIGPLQNTTSRKLELLTLLSKIDNYIHKDCIMLVIAPEGLKSHGTTDFYSFTPPKKIWPSSEKTTNSDNEEVQIEPNTITDNDNEENRKPHTIKTPDGTFRLSLYKRCKKASGGDNQSGDK